MNSFFDEVLEKAKNVADCASKKTGELVELSKYKMDAIRVNNEIEKLYQQLGKAVYSMEKGCYDNQDLIDGLIEEIDELLATLDAINEKVSDMRKLYRCPTCGARNSVDNFYCARCGERLRNEFDDFDDDDDDEYDEMNQTIVPNSQEVNPQE